MCKNILKSASNFELLEELSNRGLLTNSKFNQEIFTGGKFNNSYQVILTKGLPDFFLECRECKKHLDPKDFTYYQSRVDKKGFLMRSNALCRSCMVVSNKERKIVLENAPKNKKPEKGDTCPHCQRKWYGNWHRHHQGDKFIDWLCGHCNMSFSDQRNK